MRGGFISASSVRSAVSITVPSAGTGASASTNVTTTLSAVTLADLTLRPAAMARFTCLMKSSLRWRRVVVGFGVGIGSSNSQAGGGPASSNLRRNGDVFGSASRAARRARSRSKLRFISASYGIGVPHDARSSLTRSR